MRVTRRIISMLVLVMLCVLTACGSQTTSSVPVSRETSAETASESKEAETAPDTEPAETNTDRSVLVVYFSATGTTKGVAEKIASITDADLYEILPSEPYTSEDLNYSDKTSRTSVEQNDKSVRPEIGSDPVEIHGYTTVFLGFPIWWGEEPRIMDTFAESHDFDGITVIPFCTSGGSGIGTAESDLKDLAGSGNWIEGRRFGGNVSEADLQSWIDELK